MEDCEIYLQNFHEDHDCFCDEVETGTKYYYNHESCYNNVQRISSINHNNGYDFQQNIGEFSNSQNSQGIVSSRPESDTHVIYNFKGNLEKTMKNLHIEVNTRISDYQEILPNLEVNDQNFCSKLLDKVYGNVDEYCDI